MILSLCGFLVENKMKTKAKVPYFLFFISFSLGSWCFATADFPSCNFLLKTLSQTREINIGENVTIQTPSKEIKAKFIGISKETNTSQSFYFLEAETGRIIEIPESLLNLDGKKISNASFLLKAVGYIQTQKGGWFRSEQGRS